MSEIFNKIPILSKTENVSVEDSRSGYHEQYHCHEEFDDNDDCHSIESLVEKTILCFGELKRLALEVFKGLECGPRDKRLITVYTCFILEDISKVFKEVTAIRHLLECKEYRGNNYLRLYENFSQNVTSGTVFVTNNHSDKVRVTVLNNTADPQTVRVRVLDNSENTHTVINDISLEVNSSCSNWITQSIINASSYEIQVFQLVPGMTVSSVEEANSGSFIDGTKLTATKFTPYLGVNP